MKRAPLRLDELRRARRDDHHARRPPGGSPSPASSGRVAEHVLQELLADEHRAHQRAEHDDAGARGDPEDAPARDVEVVERDSRPALADARTRQPRRARSPTSPSASAPLSGTGAKLMPRIERRRPAATERMPPRLSTGSVASFTWAGTNCSASTSATDGERQRDEEHRAPPEVLEQRAGDQRPERGDARRRCADHSAIDFVRAGPGPQRGDQRERRRVGHAGRRGRRAIRATTSTLVGRRARGEQARRDRQRDAEDAASACGRSGRRARRATAPTPRARASSRPRSGRASVCDESNALPMSGSATLATARFRFATAATRISATRTSFALTGVWSA